MRRNRLLYAGWFTNLPRFQGARFDHVRVESSCCCFPSELVKFVRPWELLSFDPRHVTRCPPIGKRIWVGMYYNPDWCIDWLRIVQQRTDRLWSYTVLHCVAKVLNTFEDTIDHSSYTHNFLKQKSRPEGDSNPWPLRYQCSATELSSQLGAGQIVSS